MDGVLHVARVDFVAAGDDDLLQAVDQVGIAVLVHGADVAGMEPAVAQRRRGLRRLLPIARHDLWPAQADLALLAPRNRRAAAVERADDDLGARQRRSEEHTSELQSLMRISYAV